MNDGVFRARWVIPIVGQPLRDAWIAVAGGRILGTGRAPFDPAAIAPAGDGEVPARWPVTDLGDVALLPGLINAHTHLELSGLRSRVPPAASMPQWVRSLLGARAAGDDASAIPAALDEAISFGTSALADVSNTLASVEALGSRGVAAVVFHEVLGFDPGVAARRATEARARVAGCPPQHGVRLRLAPHAPYSTSPELIRAILQDTGGEAWPPTSVHVAESADEVEFLRAGQGEWRRLLTDLGLPGDGWRAPGTSPVRYLDALGMWKPGTLAVHGVHLTPADLDLLIARDVTLVTCPRSNAWVGAGDPPIARFAASGARVAVGTDSLASVADLNLFEELKQLRRLAPDVPARTLLSWATVNGAVALGLEDELGTLAAGRRGGVLAVRVPPGVRDVEERLVSGVAREDLAWLEDLTTHNS